VLASEGDPAVGAPGSTYAGLFFPSPLVSSNGWAAFRAGLEPGANFDRDGIWVAHHGQVELVAKKADPAPGLSGAVFTEFSEPVINDRGVLVFKAETTGESGIWLWDRGMLRLVLTKNDRIPVSHPTETVGIVSNFSLKTGTGTQDGYGSSLNDDCQLAVQVGFQIQIPSAIVLIPNLRDLDGDGIDCLLEDAFGSDCNDPADGAATIPHAQLDGDKLLIRFRRLEGASPYDYQVECSTDLDDWQPTGISPTLADDQSAAPPGVEIVEVAVPLDADTEKYLRVRVTLDPG
jgi:hypothetical protein